MIRICKHITVHDVPCQLPVGHKCQHGAIDDICESHERWKARAAEAEECLRSITKTIRVSELNKQERAVLDRALAHLNKFTTDCFT